MLTPLGIYQNIFILIKLKMAFKAIKQAGAELGQAQLMLGIDYTLIFCRFRFSRLGLAELVGWI